MSWGMLALAAVQAGLALYGAQEQKDAVRVAGNESADASVAEQSRLTLEQQRARREAQGAGTVLGGSPTRKASSVSKRGTTLGPNPQTRSLLGS